MRLMREMITRNMDDLGRVTVPKTTRDRLGYTGILAIDFYTLEDENGEFYIVLGKHKGEGEGEKKKD